jgi:hypothetical protein
MYVCMYVYTHTHTHTHTYTHTHNIYIYIYIYAYTEGVGPSVVDCDGTLVPQQGKLVKASYSSASEGLTVVCPLAFNCTLSQGLTVVCLNGLRVTRTSATSCL